jgi:uncharacterized membrane protein YcaP (DUF421 family)
LWDEINDLGFTDSWLTEQLKSHGVTDHKQVFLAEWLNGDGLFVQLIT